MVPFRGVNCSDAAGSQKEYQLIQRIMRENSTSGRLWNPSYKAPHFNFKVSVYLSKGVHVIIWML